MAGGPGSRGESVLARDLGMPLEQGSRVVMQVHYNLLAGTAPDTTAARLRVAKQDASRKVLSTVLLPAPVELPCRPGKTGPLCSREAALADVQKRFGERTALTGNYLNMICQGVGPSPTQRCTRPVTEPATIRAVAGHMHLLGRSLTVTVNEGRADERTVLDIPVWNFDDQGSRAVTPAAKVDTGDTVTVTCTHDQACGTGSRPSRGSRSATSCGARARPTRCASASSWSPARRGCRARVGWRPTPDRRGEPSVHGQSIPAQEAGREFVLTVSCPDRRGIVHAVTGVLLEQSLTIADAQQFGDPSSGSST